MVSRFAGALALVVCMQANAQPSPKALLAPGPVIRGALLMPAVDPTGTPRGPLGPFTPLRQPIAVAARGQDLYVVDAGHGTLFRIDPHANQMVAFPGRPFQHGTRIAVDVDMSLFVLDPINRRIQRFSRDGRLLGTFVTDSTLGTLSDFVLDPARGRILAVDRLHTQLVAFRPLGRAFQILPLVAEPRFKLQSLVGIAVTAEGLYGADPRCGCLARMTFDGAVLSTFAHQRVAQPEKLAADRHGRVFVFDRFDRTLKVFTGETLTDTVPLAALGLAEATDLAIDEGWLYIADGAGAQVRMLRIAAPRAEREPRKN
jgi:hypothetical protein